MLSLKFIFCRKPGNLEQRLWTTHRFLSISRQVWCLSKSILWLLYCFSSVAFVWFFLTFFWRFSDVFLTFFWRQGCGYPPETNCDTYAEKYENHSAVIIHCQQTYDIPFKIWLNYNTFLILPATCILSYNRLYRLARRSRATIQRWTPGSSSPIMTS